MRIVTTAVLAATVLLGGCGEYGGGGPVHAGGRGYRDYDYNRPDPAYNGYYANRYYRDDRRYRDAGCAIRIASMPAMTGVIIAAGRTVRPG